MLRRPQGLPIRALSSLVDAVVAGKRLAVHLTEHGVEQQTMGCEGSHQADVTIMSDPLSTSGCSIEGCKISRR